MTTSTTAGPRILRLKQVKERIGLGRSTIYSRMDVNSPGYDSTFPPPIRLGGGSGAGGAVGWLEAHIDSWLLARIAESLNPAAGEDAHSDHPGSCQRVRKTTGRAR